MTIRNRVFHLTIFGDGWIWFAFRPVYTGKYENRNAPRGWFAIERVPGQGWIRQ